MLLFSSPCRSHFDRISPSFWIAFAHVYEGALVHRSRERGPSPGSTQILRMLPEILVPSAIQRSFPRNLRLRDLGQGLNFFGPLLKMLAPVQRHRKELT